MQAGSVGCISAICLLTVVLMSLLPSGHCIPGEYRSLSVLRNKYLGDPDLIVKTIDGADVGDNVDNCMNKCKEDPVCTGFAYSKSYSQCILYKIRPGTPPVQNSGYDIYIKMYSEAEGYYIFDTGYIRLMYKRKSGAEARRSCQDLGGNLPTVKSKKLNDLLYGLLVTNNMWHAYIGLSDEEEEGTWKWPDGSTEMKFKDGVISNNEWPGTSVLGSGNIEKWDWNGVWGRKDRNCAVIINGFEMAPWKQLNCKRHEYYFCQIPMF